MLTDYIQKYRALLEKNIHDFFEEKKKTTPVELTTLYDSLEHLQTNIPRGKLLRGIQILLAYEMFGGTNQNEALTAATALEITHAGVLMQDDFMDNDYTRRGVRSVFAQYLDSGKTKGTHDSLLYGQSMATCIGDISFFITYELLSSCSANPSISQSVIKLFSHEWQLVGGGQMMDVDFSSRDYEPTAAEVMTIYRYKTARYSFSLPLSIGALLAETDESTIKQLDTLGEGLGIIFQIKDDELGLFGDEKTLGKPVSSDIRENKKTLFRSMLMKKATEEEKKSLMSIYGNKNLTTDEIESVKNLIVSYGIADEIQKKVEAMSKEALEIIDEISADKVYKNLLHEFVELNLQRKK